MSVRLVLVLLGTALGLFLARGILHFDPASYCRFADTQTHFGVPNFWNVITNLGFVWIGVVGLRRAGSFPADVRLLGRIFSAALVATAFGSAYFHWETTPPRLFWDQLPMSVGFGSFVGIVLADRIRAATGRWIGIGLSIVGPISVWNIYYGNGETAFYLALQFGSLIFAILLLLAFPRGSLRRSWILVGIGFYVFAKVLELKDEAIFAVTGFMSGHSLKHLSATAALYAILRAFPISMEEITHDPSRKEVPAPFARA